MAYQNSNSASKIEKAVPVASIQPLSFNGVNFTKTNLYANNPSHMLLVDFAKAKIAEDTIAIDGDGIQSVTLNDAYTIRIYGDKPATDTTSHQKLY